MLLLKTKFNNWIHKYIVMYTYIYIVLTSSVAKLMKFDWINPKASQNDFAGR